MRAESDMKNPKYSEWQHVMSHHERKAFATCLTEVREHWRDVIGQRDDAVSNDL